jgi:hypothetical protein
MHLKLFVLSASSVVLWLAPLVALDTAIPAVMKYNSNN